jgi:predicted lipoprotein with Yx(FWY)xxD motif
MSRSIELKFARSIKVVGGAAAAVVLVAGCGGSNGSGNLSTNNGSSGSPGGAVTVATHSGPLGSYLSDGSGKSLYMFSSDSAGKSSCTGACLTYWPPLTTTRPLASSGDAKDSLLGVIKRADGSKQVTYDGHPLYYFSLDKSVGDTLGQGRDDFGAEWWLLAPAGAPITRDAGTPSSPAGGYGY